jgi:hypothetical protein
VLNRGRRTGTAEGGGKDGKGRLLAHGTITCLIFEHWMRRFVGATTRARPRVAEGSPGFEGRTLIWA